MYFDPLSAWLVSLIADGIIVAEEKIGGSTAQAEYDRERIKQGNEGLNGNIRRVREDYGLYSPEWAYEKIQRHIKATKNLRVFKYTDGQIVIDLDNQEYIIALLEACSKKYSKYEMVEEHRKKAEWYKNAAIEARKRKEQYTIKLEETRIRETLEKEKEQTVGKIYITIGLIMLVAFVIFFFSK